MSNLCSKHTVTLLVFILYLVLPRSVLAGACGDGSCKPKEGETCLTCPVDCGECPTSTPNPTAAPTIEPVPTLTPTPPPNSTPTPNPDATTTPSTTSSSGSPNVTYAPSINIVSHPANPTNKATLAYSGTVSIEQGYTSAVEFSITDGAQWLSAKLNDVFFSFTTPALSEGTHTVKIRAKSNLGIYSDEVSSTCTIVTTPPAVTLDTLPTITKDITPVISGSVSSNLGTIARIEISLNNGIVWIPMKTTTAFRFEAEPLEDGNYQILARAFDNTGNIGKSKTQTLIVDTIPPIIGGCMQTFGPQILTPEGNGEISVVAGIPTTIAMSMKGGVTEAKIVSGENSFDLSPLPNSNIWMGTLTFDQAGKKQLIITATDGAQNKTQRLYNTFYVKNFGVIQDSKTKNPIENAKVSFFFLESMSSQWILWDGSSFGQTNPQKTNPKGNYSFMVPAGKYYLEVEVPGYKTLQSEIVTVNQNTIINPSIKISSKPKLTFSLPFFGEIVLTIPDFAPPETVKIDSQLKLSQNQKQSSLINQPAPIFSLPTIGNKKNSPEQFRGKKLLLTFISSWSPLSLEQVPFLSEASRSIPSDMTILAVSLQESILSTESFMKRSGYSFPVVADKDGTTAENYNVTLLPYHIFIDSKGIVKDVYTGVLNKNELLKRLSNMP